MYTPEIVDSKNKGISTEDHYKDFGFLKVNNTPDNNEIIWYGNNEWNKIYDGTKRLVDNVIEPTETAYLKALTTDGNGGQVVTFNNFTYHPEINKGPESNVVAYSYGSSDSPFEFNDELRQQQQVLSDYYNVNGVKFKKPRNTWPHTKIEEFSFTEYETYITDYPRYTNIDVAQANAYPKKVITLDGWNETSTPSGIWMDNDADGIYIGPSKVYSTATSPISDTTNYLTNANGTIGTTPALSILSSLATEKKFPFIPGWALWYHFANNNTVPPDWVNAISAGVDCNGFVSRSASYSGNSYGIYKSRNEDVTKRVDWFTNPQYPYYRLITGKPFVVISDKVTDKNNKDDFDKIILNKIKPGDLMYLETLSGSHQDEGWHITMVLDVELSENMGLTNIKLIESTWAGDKSWAKVIKSYTLNKYFENKWVVVRLQQ